MNNVRYGIKIDDKISVINQPISKRMLLTDNDNIIGYDQLQENSSKVKVSYSYFNKNIYNREEFKTSGFSKRRNIIKEIEQLNKKRKRSPDDE